jgi:hypothetical protein
MKVIRIPGLTLSRINPLTVAGRPLWEDFHLYPLAETVHNVARTS